MVALAGLAHCSLKKVTAARDKWVPKWRDAVTPLFRQTWLGKCRQVFSEMQAVPVDENSATDDSAHGNDGDDNRMFDSDFVCLDGKVFDGETSRAGNFLHGCMQSSKTGSSGFQTMVWSMPCGTPFLVTGLFGAKCSEKRQVAMHSRWLAAVPEDVAVLKDRGLRMLQRYYPKFVR